MAKSDKQSSKGIIATIERVGNKMPHPVILFLFLIVALMIVSLICAQLGVSVTYQVTGNDGELIEKTAAAINMLSKEQLVNFLVGATDNFKTFSTLSLSIIMVMGMALSEKTGFFSALLRKTLLSAPKGIITYALAVIGICCNICSDPGVLLASTLGGIIFKSLGRNPWVGIFCGYVSAAVGFTANLLPAATDAVLGSMTNEVCEMMNLPYTVHPLSNYIFMAVSTFVLAAVVAVLTETFLVKTLGDSKTELSGEALEKAKPSKEENRGLRFAGVAFLVLLAILLWGCVPSDGFLRNENGQLLPTSPLMSSIVILLSIIFTVLGVAYGIGSGVIKSGKDYAKFAKQGLEDMNLTFILFFLVSQMLYVMNTSNLATIISVSGERLLRSIGMGGFPLLVVFILVVGIINLCMASATSKWAILAPVFVPMMTNLGIHPAVIQTAFRIGDTCTKGITPMSPMLWATLEILNANRDPRYNKEEAGVGTVISIVSVFSIVMLVAFIALFAVFYFLNIPVGIGM